jgi:hypothetical protein
MARRKAEKVDGVELRQVLAQVAKQVAGAELPDDLTAQRTLLLSEVFSTGYLLLQEAADLALKGPLKGLPREKVTFERLKATGESDVLVLLNALEALSLVLGRFTPRVEMNLDGIGQA